MPPDGVIPGGPAFGGSPATPVEPSGPPASADGFLSLPGGPDFGGYPQPPDVPVDPVGDDWRGPPGPAGPPGPQGPQGEPGGTTGGGSGTVTSVASGAGLSGGPITTTGTLVADWHAGVVVALGSNLTLTGGTLDATGGGPGTAGVTTWNARDGDVVLLSADVTGALGYTPYSNANPAGYQTAANVTASLAPYALTSSVPAARNAARMQAAWDGTAVVENDTYYLCFDAPYAGTVNTLKYFTGAGSFTVAIQIGGVSVTGLSSVAVSSATPATATATAANTFSAGAQITAVVTGATGDPVNALLSLAVTWS